MKRRKFITAGILSGIGITLPGSLAARQRNATRSLRIVHITDTHIFPDPIPEKGVGNLVTVINQMEDKPDFVLHTGDHIMDALARPKDEVEAQWTSWKKVFRDPLKIPLYNVLGNHDVWGWGLKDDSVKKEAKYGKTWAKEILELDNTFYSFSGNGWKIICLDSVSPDTKNRSYKAHLGKEQIQWLAGELENTSADTHVLIASHIPILSPSAYFDGDNEKSGNWQVPGAWMHLDARDIKDLFYKYPNVKGAISGHIHLGDYARYLKVNYYCNGAACGGWWKGNYQEFPPAYAVIDLYNDGTIVNELVPYQWQ
ncbi:MAG: metallophosphoesterase family protein [Mariniphaga sp.]